MVHARHPELSLVAKPRVYRDGEIVPFPRATRSELAPAADPAALNVSRPMGVVQRVKLAFHPKSRLAACIGLLFGGIIPVFSFELVHGRDSAPDWRTAVCLALVAGGLVVSAKTVYEWAKLTYSDTGKAAGLVVILEGVMLVSDIPWTQYAALGFLVLVNSTAAACQLALAPRGRV